MNTVPYDLTELSPSRREAFDWHVAETGMMPLYLLFAGRRSLGCATPGFSEDAGTIVYTVPSAAYPGFWYATIQDLTASKASSTDGPVAWYAVPLWMKLHGFDPASCEWEVIAQPAIDPNPFA